MEDIQQVLGQLFEMFDEMEEAGRMRSDFALRHFVVGQHDTPGRQRAQALVELQTLYFSLADMADDRSLAMLDLDENAKITERTPRLEIERGRIERRLLQINYHLAARTKEVLTLMEIVKALPRYTAEQLEAEEPEYWTRRLTRQTVLAMRDPGGNLSALLEMITTPGHIKPMPAGIGPGDFLLGLGLDVKAIASGLVTSGIMTMDQAEKMIHDVEGPKQLTPPKVKRKRK